MTLHKFGDRKCCSRESRLWGGRVLACVGVCLCVHTRALSGARGVVCMGSQPHCRSVRDHDRGGRCSAALGSYKEHHQRKTGAGDRKHSIDCKGKYSADFIFCRGPSRRNLRKGYTVSRFQVKSPGTPARERPLDHRFKPVILSTEDSSRVLRFPKKPFDRLKPNTDTPFAFLAIPV